jgi:SAM-dependent methyltransferase
MIEGCGIPRGPLRACLSLGAIRIARLVLCPVVARLGGLDIVRRARRGARFVAQKLDTVPFLREALLPALFVAIYVLIGGVLGFQGHSKGGEIFGGAVAAVLGYWVGLRTRMRGFQRSVRIIRDIADQSTLSPGRGLYVQMILDRMSEAKSIVDGFQHDTYKVRSPEQLQGWIGAFFKLGGGNYAGVDSHPPSRYWLDYAWFLDAHARSLQHRRECGEPANDVRILSIAQGELDDDWFGADTRLDYQRFVAWHTTNDVELKTISPDRLAEIRGKHDLDTTDDIALWVKFAALFTGQDARVGDDVTIRLRAKRDIESIPHYGIINSFMADVRQQSTTMSDAPPGVEMGDAALIARWDDYIAPDVRWLDGGPYPRFMGEILDRDAAIFDAATGSGTDSVNLLMRGYSVTSNEVDPRLALRASSFAQQRGVAIDLKSARWEDLSLSGNPRFDFVLVLGNSICLVSSAERRRLALAAFWNILRPGGALLIDERNYEFMRRNREDILRDPLNNWVRRTADAMYPGRSLVGFPSSIEGTRVQWAFASNSPEPASSAELRHKAQEFHPLDLYAFRHGELQADLAKQGFVDISVYGDFNRLTDGILNEMPSYEATASAGFLTYIATRPARMGS